jgi:hypothetical protein
MATASENKTPASPPDEKFWVRYSPHHECILSGLSSITLHALVVGLLFLSWFIFTLARTSEEYRPPRMDVVTLPAGGEPGGGTPGGPSEGVENVDSVQANKAKIPEIKIQPPKTNVLEVAPTTAKDTIGEATDPFQGLDAEASKLFKTKEEAKKPPRTASKTPSQKRGTGGLGTEGTGTGFGPGTGPGTGLGGLNGPTKQQIFAQRWQFNFTGTPQEHVAKLAAAGVYLGVFDQTGRFYRVADLKRRPARLVPENIYKFKDAVQYRNTDAASLLGLQVELRLSFTPVMALVLVPRQREEELASVEAAHAQQQGRNPDQIRKTYFDFRPAGNRFVPVVIDQEYAR